MLSTEAGSVQKFIEMAGQSRFNGWPIVGEYRLGAKIPFFGQVLEYDLETDNGVEHYASIIRHFGWVVVFGVTNFLDNIYPNTDAGSHVITLVQWKPGVNRASWELPPGGIGKVGSDITQEGLLTRTREFYLRETGYGGGEWDYLGKILIETGKYRGASPEDHGLPAHMFLATNLERQSEARKPSANEIMENLLVPLDKFGEVIDSGLFVEASAVPCALLAMRKLHRL